MVLFLLLVLSIMFFITASAVSVLLKIGCECYYTKSFKEICCTVSRIRFYSCLCKKKCERID